MHANEKPAKLSSQFEKALLLASARNKLLDLSSLRTARGGK